MCCYLVGWSISWWSVLLVGLLLFGWLVYIVVVSFIGGFVVIWLVGLYRGGQFYRWVWFIWFSLRCLMLLSTIFQLYRGGQFYWFIWYTLTECILRMIQVSLCLNWFWFLRRRSLWLVFFRQYTYIVGKYIIYLYKLWIKVENASFSVLFRRECKWILYFPTMYSQTCLSDPLYIMTSFVSRPYLFLPSVFPCIRPLYNNPLSNATNDRVLWVKILHITTIRELLSNRKWDNK